MNDLFACLPCLPLAKMTEVGFSVARKAANISVRTLLSRMAAYRPRPSPTNEPTVVCVATLLVALTSASRSDWVRSALMCSLASLVSSSCCGDLRNAARGILFELWGQFDLQVDCKISWDRSLQLYTACHHGYYTISCSIATF